MNSFRKISIVALADVAAAELGPEGQEICVLPKAPASEFHGKDGEYLCAEFANWASDSQEVLRFTRRYGSLTGPPESGHWITESDGRLRYVRPDGTYSDPPVPLRQFSFSIENWKNYQNRLRRLWDMSCYSAEGGNRNVTFGIETIQVEDGEDFFWTPKKLVYRTRCLFRFIWIEFHCIPLDRLRKCGSKDCKTPYFVAKHLGQRYCSDICARSAQREWKKEWWKNRGTEWRRSRLKKSQKTKKRGGAA